MIEEADDPHRPWLRLYRRGSARFQQLEPHYRGTLIEILRYTDSAGRINLDGRSPEEALLRLLGNTRSFRPVLKAALAEGFRIEMCSVIDGHLVFQSWSKYQPGGARPQSKSRASAEQEQSASQEQSNDVAEASQERRNDVARASQEQSNDRAFTPNPAESLNTQKDTREEKRRGEESERAGAPPPPRRSPSIDGQPLNDWLRCGVVKGYKSLKLPPPRETKTITWSGWAELERWVIEKSELLGTDDHRETGRHLIRCFMRSQAARKKGYLITFLVHNANEYWRDELPTEVSS